MTACEGNMSTNDIMNNDTHSTVFPSAPQLVWFHFTTKTKQTAVLLSMMTMSYCHSCLTSDRICSIENRRCLTPFGGLTLSSLLQWHKITINQFMSMISVGTKKTAHLRLQLFGSFINIQ